jgi:hypothetical protein
MRYVLIVMCLFSASVQAIEMETWYPHPESQTVFVGEIQMHSIEKQNLWFFNPTKTECCIYDSFMIKNALG